MKFNTTYTAPVKSEPLTIKDIFEAIKNIEDVGRHKPAPSNIILIVNKKMAKKIHGIPVKNQRNKILLRKLGYENMYGMGMNIVRIIIKPHIKKTRVLYECQFKIFDTIKYA